MVRSLKKSRPLAFEEKATSTKHSPCLFLIYGDDDFLVNEEARRIIATLKSKQASEFDLEMIEGLASNQAEADIIFRRLFEALQTSSMFASEKVIWWRQTNFLGSSQVANTVSVTDSLATLNKTLKAGVQPDVSLVITATDVDVRKAIVHTIQRLGKITSFKSDPFKRDENQTNAILFARQVTSKSNKELTEEAAVLVAEMTGGDSRTINSEIEKLVAYIGGRNTIDEEDVHAIGSWRPGGVVWELPDALTERDIEKMLRALQNLLFLGETPVGLLFSIIARFRLLLILSVLAKKKLLKIGSNYPAFKAQLERLPPWISEALPQDKKLNPLGGHPYMIWKASVGLTHYNQAELYAAMIALLECNERMFSIGGDPADILKQTLIKICIPRPVNQPAANAA